MRRWLPGLLFAVLVLVGCSKLDVDPAQPPAVALPTISLRTDSVGIYFNLDSLAQGRPARVTFGMFRHGEIRATTDARYLYYVVTDSSLDWRVDSASYKVCFDSTCRSGLIRVVNARYVPPDTTGPDPNCGPVPLSTITVNEVGTTPFRIAFAGGDTGRITGISHSFYTLNRSATDNLGFTYTAVGGPQDVYAGFDAIVYEGHVLGRPVCGTIEVVIGDPCRPRARPDEVTITRPSGQVISPTLLIANDTSCGGQIATYKLRLDGRPYPGNFRQATKYGMVTDTIIAPSTARTLYYQRTQPGTELDYFFYYTENQADEFVTRARVWLF